MIFLVEFFTNNEPVEKSCCFLTLLTVKCEKVDFNTDYKINRIEQNVYIFED